MFIRSIYFLCFLFPCNDWGNVIQRLQNENMKQAEEIVSRLFEDIQKDPRETISLREFISVVGSSDALQAFFPF